MQQLLQSTLQTQLPKTYSKQQLSKTTKQEKNILYHIYTFRFLNTQYIQYFLKHKNPTRIRIWLKDLYEKGYVYRFETTKDFKRNNTPWVYCLTSKTRYVLQENSSCDAYLLDRLYREKTLGEKFRNHCLFMADIAIKLQNECNGKGEIVEYFTQRELFGYEHFPQPLPDAYVTIKKKGKRTKRYFIELFDEGMPRFAIRARIERYITCAQSSQWQEETHVPFPSVLLICQNTFIKQFILRFINQTLEEEALEYDYFVATKNELLQHEILKKLRI
jgi:hypothetical protein